jgi:hypothetical protein
MRHDGEANRCRNVEMAEERDVVQSSKTQTNAGVPTPNIRSKT